MTKHACHLLGGYFASFLQFLLGSLCILTLIIKRQYEIPQRRLYIWFLDVTKQGVGSSFGHFSNIYLSMIIAGNLSKIENANENGGDECQWYCLTYMLDATFGTIWNILCLYLLEKVLICEEDSSNAIGCVNSFCSSTATVTSSYICIPMQTILSNCRNTQRPARKDSKSERSSADEEVEIDLFRTRQSLHSSQDRNYSSSQGLRLVLSMGDYGNPPQFSIYLAQLAIYLVIVLFGKVVTVYLIYQYIEYLDRYIAWLFTPIVSIGVPELELVLVMVIVPVIVNSIQFWVTDTYLKKKTVDIEYSSVVAGEDSDLDTDLLDEGLRQQDRRKGNKSISSSTSSSTSEGFMNSNFTAGKSSQSTLFSSRSHYVFSLLQRSDMPLIRQRA
jgi:hypothetical protein